MKSTARWAMLLALTVCLLNSTHALATFGLTNSNGIYTVDNGADIVFQVRQSDAEFISCTYKGIQYQDTSNTSHIESGFGTSASVSAAVIGNAIVVTCNGDVGSSPCTHYYIVQQGVDNIYMATYVPTPDIGELRWIGHFTNQLNWQSPGMFEREPDANAVLIEADDTYVEPDGTTRSKYLASQMMKDWSIEGSHDSFVGLYMALGNRESSSGGPFFRDIESAGGVVYNYMVSQHHQTEATRGNVLHGPYALMFVAGSTVPTAQPDYSFISSLGLTGYVSAAGRGRVVLNGINGMDNNYTYTVAYSNSSAQYWVTAAANTGNCECFSMKPGTYNMTIYKGQLAVYTTTGIVVNANSGTIIGTKTITADPSNTPVIWRIGNWDGTPLEFEYGDVLTDTFPNINAMHPSDVRESWSPVTFVVGTSPTDSFPSIQWQQVNSPTTIQFNLTAAQVAAHTVNIGITDAFNSGRPKITVNSWESSAPGASVQPGGRCFTIGTYRGNNTTYSFNVPAGAFVVGTNTMTINVITGSKATDEWLSGAISYDCVELAQ